MLKENRAIPFDISESAGGVSYIFSKLKSFYSETFLGEGVLDDCTPDRGDMHNAGTDLDSLIFSGVYSMYVKLFFEFF